jgi:cytochrome P450
VKQLVYLTAVIEESLRLFPPTPGLVSRRTNVPTEIDGHIIPPDVSIFHKL